MRVTMRGRMLAYAVALAAALGASGCIGCFVTSDNDDEPTTPAGVDEARPGRGAEGGKRWTFHQLQHQRTGSVRFLDTVDDRDARMVE